MIRLNSQKIELAILKPDFREQMGAIPQLDFREQKGATPQLCDCSMKGWKLLLEVDCVSAVHNSS